MSLKGKKQSFKIQRGDLESTSMVDFEIELDEGMVVLDCVHRIQHEEQADLAVRWNCKAGKCGSCSAEINGKPRLMCMTRMSDVVSETPENDPIEIRPMKAFPLVKDLVTDVSATTSLILVMHIKRGLPFISAEHEPHFPALQFHLTAKSGSCSY